MLDKNKEIKEEINKEKDSRISQIKKGFLGYLRVKRRRTDYHNSYIPVFNFNLFLAVGLPSGLFAQSWLFLLSLYNSIESLKEEEWLR